MKKKVRPELLKRSWWVFLFILINSIGFNIALRHAGARTQQLKDTYHSLEQTKQRLQKNQNQLSFQIKSLEDHKTVELILKKELGLVSERQTKVYFANQ